MEYVTDRKRAQGMGSARSGTAHFWSMTQSACYLAVLIPLFVFTFAPMLGQPHDMVLAHFARPFPAIVAGLTLVAGFTHFRQGVRVAIEDYTSGLTREALIIATAALSWAAMATGLFALVRLAL